MWGAVWSFAKKAIVEEGFKAGKKIAKAASKQFYEYMHDSHIDEKAGTVKKKEVEVTEADESPAE